MTLKVIITIISLLYLNTLMFGFIPNNDFRSPHFVLLSCNKHVKTHLSAKLEKMVYTAQSDHAFNNS